MINPDTNLPPGCLPQDLSDRQHRRDRLRDEASEAEDDRADREQWWRDWVKRREREESQRGNEGEPHE